jgi:undecaprenyl-diphosphatase
MSWLDAAILGLIQGLTEFLPISSSGHLVLGRHLLGVGIDDSSGILFEALVHFGTVMSILAVYWKDVVKLVTGFLGGIVHPSMYQAHFRDDEFFRTAVLILVTIVPAGIAFLFFMEPIESAFTHPRFSAGMLLVTGVLLILTRLRKKPSGDVTVAKAVGIGIAQSLAMFPGISRSGATICAGIYQNVDPEKATNFSFLMLLPVVIVGTALKISEALAVGAPIIWGPMMLGVLIAFVSGIGAIKLVLDFVRKGRLEYFAFYCFLVGTVGLILL